MFLLVFLSLLLFGRMRNNRNLWGSLEDFSALLVQFLIFGVGLYVIELKKEFQSGRSLVWFGAGQFSSCFFLPDRIY